MCLSHPEGGFPGKTEHLSVRRSCSRCGQLETRCTLGDCSTGCQQCRARGLECPVNPAQDPIQGRPGALKRLYLEDEPPEEAKVGLKASPQKSQIMSLAKFSTGACTPCKTLKIECEHDIGAESCRRCLEGGYECVVSNWKTRHPLGACIRCKKLKVKCKWHNTGAESCQGCLTAGNNFKCVVPGRRARRTPESVQPETFPFPSSLGKPDIKTGRSGDFAENFVMSIGGATNNKSPELLQTDNYPNARSQSSSVPADDPSVDMDENTPWFESARYITADEAFAFVSDLEIPLRVAFADVKFRGQYMIQVGFNESMLHQGKLVEEVYLLLDADLWVPGDDVCTTFTAVFAPFPAVVYTPEQTYYLPVDPQGQGGRTLRALGEFQARGRGSGSSGNRPSGAAHFGEGRGNDGENRKGTRSNQDRRVERDRNGAREEDGDEHDDDEPNKRGGKTESGSHKRVRRSAQIINIPFGSTLSIAGIDGSDQVNTVAGVDITVSSTLSSNQRLPNPPFCFVKIDENKHGTSSPPDLSWSGPWFRINMTELEVSSIFVGRPAYLLSLAQVQVTAFSPEPVRLLHRSPQHLRTEGDSARRTVTRNTGFSLGTVLSSSPSVQAQYSAGGASGTETGVRRWDVTSWHNIMDKTQLKDESDGAVWKYIHNDAIFGRVEGWSFDHELRPSAVFGFSDAKPEVEVKVTVFWSSEAHAKPTKPRDSFPFRWLRAKEQQSVFANFVYQVAVVVDLEKVKDERSWIMPRKPLDSVKRKELSGTKGPIYFDPITAAAKAHSEEVVSITRGFEERARLTAPERTSK